MKQIDQFFHDDLLTMKTSPMLKIRYKSGYTCRTKMRVLVHEPEWQNGTVDIHLQAGVKFFYRDMVECIRYLLRQKVFAKDLVFEPSCEFDREGCRVYTEMHTAECW